MSIRAKVMACFVTVLVLFAAVAAYNFVRLSRSNARLALLNQIFLPLSRLTVEIQARTIKLAEDLRRSYFVGGGSSEQSTFSRVARDLYPYIILRKFGEAERLIARHEEAGVGLGGLRSDLLAARKEFEALVQANGAAELKSRFVALRAKLRALSSNLDSEANRVTADVQAEGRDTLLSNLILSSLVVVFGIFTLVFSLKTFRPLPQLIDSLKKIADGDFNQSLKVKAASSDEVSLLAREYNRMLGALRVRDQKIQEQQKEILQSERLAAVGQLSAEVVHEIRNPLNSISLNIDWLQSELASTGEETSRTLRSISREIERLNQITERYLVRARVKADSEERAEAHEVLEEVLEFCREEDRARNIEVKTDFTSQKIYVKTGRAQLKQVFLNVLKNAREAMPRGGTITVRSRVADNTSVIEFQDTGFGMNETTRRKTFSPFFTTKHNGTGLGLVLTKNIVEEAQGIIRCESELGRGTKFAFQFPV